MHNISASIGGSVWACQDRDFTSNAFIPGNVSSDEKDTGGCMHHDSFTYPNQALTPYAPILFRR